MPTPTYCPTCGVPVAPGTQLCGNCGSSVHPTGSYPVITPPPPEPVGRTSRGRRVVLAGIALVVVVVGVAALVTRANADEAPVTGPGVDHPVASSDLEP